MSEAARRVREAARDARSNDDRVRADFEVFQDEMKNGPPDPPHPLDESTLDEIYSTQLGGSSWDEARRDAN